MWKNGLNPIAISFHNCGKAVDILWITFSFPQSRLQLHSKVADVVL